MKNTTTQTIENQTVMTTQNTHLMANEIAQMQKAIEMFDMETTIETPSQSYYVVKNKDGKMISQHTKITRVWESIEEFYTSPEMIERFEMYDHVRIQQFNQAIKWDQDGTFKFIKGIQMNGKLFKVYQTQYVMMIKEITISSMMSTAPLHEWNISRDWESVTVYNRNWEKSQPNIKQIGSLFNPMNEKDGMFFRMINDNLMA